MNFLLNKVHDSVATEVKTATNTLWEAANTLSGMTRVTATGTGCPLDDVTTHVQTNVAVMTELWKEMIKLLQVCTALEEEVKNKLVAVSSGVCSSLRPTLGITPALQLSYPCG